MDAETRFSATSAQRRRLLALLDGLADAQWDVPSLCAGWRVRDVVGHLLSIIEIPRGRFNAGVLRARSFHRFAGRVAVEFGARDPADLKAAYAAVADTRFAPPLLGPIAPLTDVHVHTLDIARALGRIPDFDTDAVGEVLTWCCGGRAIGFVPRRRTRGLQFEATDIEWSAGEGPTVSGHSHDLLLALTGRRGGLTALGGDGMSEFARRFA